jgi:CDP-diacylglycerol--glycerol-3-phosphate 3-phosphatidyltransferase
MIPNILTILRIASAPILVVVLLSNEINMVILGLIIFIVSSITDFLDGYLARSFNQLSKLGKILDPIADKLLITCALISLISNNIIQDIHVIAATLIIIREIFISGLREYIRGNVLKVTFLAKVKTTIQMIAIILLIPSEVLELNFDLQILGLLFLWISSILSLITAYQYVKVSITSNDL